jgi:hypothetical protein
VRNLEFDPAALDDLAWWVQRDRKFVPGDCHLSVVIGHWSLVIGHWSLVIGHWSLVIGHWSLVIGRALVWDACLSEEVGDVRSGLRRKP